MAARKKVAKKKVAAAPKVTRYTFQIDECLEGELELSVESTAWLVMNRFGPKARKMILDKQVGKNAAKKDLSPKDVNALYLESMHVVGKNPTTARGVERAVLGIPSVAFKAAMVRAACVHGEVMTDTRAKFQVAADGFSDEGDSLVQLTEHAAPRVLQSAVRIKGTADIRIRAAVDWWKASIRVLFDPTVVSPQKLFLWARTAGRSVGVLEWRPCGKSTTGTKGTFKITEAAANVPIADDSDDET